MSTRKGTLVAVAVACCLIVAAAGLAAHAVPAQHSIDWYVIGGGGGVGESVSGTIGQAMVGSVGDEVRSVCAGFWCGAVGRYAVYLPLVVRGYH
jgi:hypothetical protein